jgi:UPF0755 protein
VPRRKRRSSKGLFVLIPLVGIIGGGFYFKTLLDAPETGSPQTVVLPKSQGLSSVLKDLESKGIIKNARAASILAILKSTKKKTVDAGSYKFAAGMSASEVLDTLKSPIKLVVRIPEERWAARVAKLLEEKKVLKAADYIALSKESSKFKSTGIPFFSDSLEGFLYPDTYTFAPDLGAELVIERQLENFAKRTAGLGLTEKNARRTIIIASLLELEASDYKEKQMIAGVIENRLMRKMRLQIDATINYAMQLWRPLTYADYTNVKSPYNTYLHAGLPPGPICSPTVKSIEAALHPIKHNNVYYITMPDGITRFTPTYPEHLKNVKLRDTIKAKKK